VAAALAARFLRMTEAVAKGNLVAKLDSFFDSCILQGWKDPIAALTAAWRISGWSESRIVQPCVDAIVEKILTPPSKVDALSFAPNFDFESHLKFFFPVSFLILARKRLMTADYR
jgi:hypothetical protein